MHYTFPIIKHIDDVLPYVEHRDDIIVAERDNYIVINYVVAKDNTFTADLSDYANLIRRECRGLIFDKKTGNIISRRFHKFFNVNERQETLAENVDLSKHHGVIHKADGSMIAPFITSDGVLRWGTKMGETEVAKQVLEFIEQNPIYKIFASICINNGNGFTPIFEWCSRENRVVIDHEKPRLILLAIRNMTDGTYVPRSELKNLCGDSIELVEEFDSKAPLSELIDFVRKESNTEGYVITFDDGHMVKIKTEWYVAIHKMKDNLLYERKVIDMILNNTLDDVKSFVMEYDRKRLEDYEKAFWLWVDEYVMLTHFILHEIAPLFLDRKTFALEHSEKFNLFKPFIFKNFDKYMNKPLETTVRDDVLQMVKNHLVSNTKLVEFKKSVKMDMEW